MQVIRLLQPIELLNNYSGKWQATCCLPKVIRAGSVVVQASCAFQQRVRKRHPEGGFAGLGTSPVKTILVCLRIRSCFGLARGTAEISAFV